MDIQESIKAANYATPVYTAPAQYSAPVYDEDTEATLTTINNYFIRYYIDSKSILLS